MILLQIYALSSAAAKYIRGRNSYDNEVNEGYFCTAFEGQNFSKTNGADLYVAL